MLPSVAPFMQPGTPQAPPVPQVVGMTQQSQPSGTTLVLQEAAPLSPAPSNLQMARPSKPWRMYGRIVGLVILFFMFEISFFEGWAYSIYGQEAIGALSFFCAIPWLLWAVAIRKPRAVLLERAVPDVNGGQLHVITTQSGSLQTPMRTRFDRHLIRDDSVLDVPSTMASWIVFGLTIITSIGLWAMIFIGSTAIQFLAALALIPVIIVGFSIPVMAWWSHSTNRIGLPTRRRDAENWLIAGILSAIPALFINSIIFPELVIFIFPDISFENLEHLIVVISAPVGEEICKGLAIVFFASKIKSPKHGFQIGFTVGLGFAILENLMYVGGTAGSPVTIFIRGIGSIPGHAVWTGLTGGAIGWTLMQKRSIELHHAAQSGIQIKPPEKDSTQWKLVDKKTGAVIETPGQEMQSGVAIAPSGIEIWKPAQTIVQKEPMLKIPLPKNVYFALFLAMIGHASWNGTFTIFAIYAASTGMSVMVEVVLTIFIMAAMILGVLVIGSGLLHSVRSAPDGSEVDEYQSQLASITAGNQLQ
jgi:RsiW-degrading membrane proteinase PrsW (M82 family)